MREPTHYANPGKRLAAALLDGIILSIPLGIIGAIMLMPAISEISQQSETVLNSETVDPEILNAFIGAYMKFLLVVLVVRFFYFTLMESSSKQATIGKMALSIMVTDQNGDRLTFGKAAIRSLGRIINSFIVGIGYLIILFTEKKQGLHDLIASSLVLDAKQTQLDW